MDRSRAVSLCLLLTALLAEMCSGLMLQRVPRHIPRTLDPPEEDDDALGALDTSVEKKRIVDDRNRITPLLIKPTWKAISSVTQKRIHKKRSTHDVPETSERVKIQLANILKDDDEPEQQQMMMKKNKKDLHAKRKRESSDESVHEVDDDEGKEVLEPRDEKFQEWLRREYYRNIAKSFASMRRKRDESAVSFRGKRTKKSAPQRTVTSLAGITENLRNMEDQLFADALQVLREDEEDEDEGRRQSRISNDLNLAYDLEKMRSAFFGLQETLQHMESEDQDHHYARKRSRECPSLDQLTSDCSSLSDVMPEGSLKRLLLKACNWHEVCYTCGKAYGLTAENCDGSFIEQTQTICRDDAPCESTASLLMVPLRQRRVFYKRSNPDECVDDPCVAEFLREGVAAMEEGHYLSNP